LISFHLKILQFLNYQIEKKKKEGLETRGEKKRPFF